jgi:hypothetical protein
MPTLLLNVSDWSYNIIPMTSPPNPNIEIYGNTYSLNTIDHSSILTFGNSSLYSCLTTSPSPRTSCQVGDTIDFTIVQKLPSFKGEYDKTWTTDVFYLPNITSPPVANILKSAYVFKGTLVFTRKLISIIRVNSNSNAKLDKSTISIYPIESQEAVYQNIKIGCLIQLYKQFNSVNSDGYVWSQTKDFEMTINGIANLLPEYKDYNTSSFVGEFIDRITTLTKFWATTSSNSKASPIAFRITIGEPVERILFGYPLIFGFLLLVIWAVLVKNHFIRRFFLALSLHIFIKGSEERRANNSK